MINHYNKTLTKYILNIMEDCNERNIDMIKHELESIYGLIFEKDYKNHHLYNALSFLKKNGKLKNIRHSVYVKENNTIKLYNNFLNLLRDHYKEIDLLLIRINHSNASNKYIKDVEMMHDYKQHLEKTIIQINQIIVENNS